MDLDYVIEVVNPRWSPSAGYPITFLANAYREYIPNRRGVPGSRAPGGSPNQGPKTGPEITEILIFRPPAAINWHAAACACCLG